MQPTTFSRILLREELLQNLHDSKLLPADEIARAVQAYSPTDPDTDGMRLAQALVSAGLLTGFQMEVVCARRFEALRIGHYEVLDRLGAGGMGTVYKARHPRMKRLVAIKVLQQNLCQQASFVQRFQREVETVARLSHPNIVMAYDADVAEAGHFLVMEYVDGRDLASWVQRQGPFAPAEAVRCLLQAARGLEYAHGQRLIHRDVKPANLLLDQAGVVKITDLGLARFSNPLDRAAGSSALTQAGGILGTIDYMPPEQAIDSTTIDHRADIYSLGCTLFFLLTAVVPYPGDSLMGVLLKHREAPIPTLSARRPGMPPELDELFASMVAKRPADRPQTMGEVVRALEALERHWPGLPKAPPSGVRGAAFASPAQHSATLPGLVPEAASPLLGSATVALGPAGTQHDTALTVVLAEPSRTQATIIRQFLKGLGLEPLATVATGQEALEAVRKHWPSVVLAAFHLKDMTGVQLAQQVRAASTVAPGFVLISSEDESKEVGSLSKAGKAVLLRKPFGPEQLAQALRVVTDRPLPAVPAGPPPVQGAGAGTAPAAAQPAPGPGPEGGGRSKYRVLIVDDSAAARAQIRVLLRNQGFSQLVEVADGAQAVAALAREPFDLVFTDYNMPYLDGQGLVGYLRQNSTSATLPIVLVSSEQDPARLAAMRQLGVTAICDKSFKADAVKAIIDRIFPPEGGR